MSPVDPVIDPEVRVLVRAGRARVLVMLQVPDIGDETRRADAIVRAQDAVLARLPQTHASVVRRYSSIPLLALEIDATALSALKKMTDVVTGVKLDRTVTPQ
jgi:sulfur transfer complex TusBCD TusB component (DsrH family)